MFYSQYNQDEYLENQVFKSFKNGIFVDVGAHDGRTLNNTLYFENTHNWTGINIEPLKDVYDNLIINRPNCINLNIAVDENNGITEFISNKGYTEMLSGLKKHYDSRHNERMLYEIQHYGGSTDVIQIETMRLENIFDKYNIKHVNYLSIDVEGGEFSVIKSINFEKVFIDIIGFENNYDDNSTPILDFLKEKGYNVKDMSSRDIFMIHKDSKFV
jgi:FkbM family methyltransferase